MANAPKKDPFSFNIPPAPPPPPTKGKVPPPPPPPPPYKTSEETMPAGQLPTLTAGPAGKGPSAPRTQANIPTMLEGSSPRSQARTMVSGASFASNVPTQDLTGEKMLMPATRSTYQQHAVPTLGGIPLISKLGQGGMGAVYLGFDPKTQTEVAVKVLPFHMAERDPILIDRFFREAQMAMRITSPNLVSVSDAREEQGLCYLVMEYVAGSSAGGYLKKHKSSGVSEAEALEICIAATKGLCAAHKENIIHRDIKPDNILIPQDGNGTLQFTACKLADLGLARSEEHGNSLTGSQATMGTPGYMSPEQARDARKCGKPADIFSMGACLYALLSGRPPFHGKSPMDIILDTMQKQHEPLANLRPNVAAPTVALIDRCLQKDPQHRFKDATSLLKALQLCREVLNKPDQHSKAVEQLRGNAPAAAAPAAEPYFDDLTYQANAKPRHVEVEAMALDKAGLQQKSSQTRMIAALLLASFLGAGVAMLVMQPAAEKEQAVVVEAVPIPKEIQRRPDPAPPKVLTQAEKDRLNKGMKVEDIRDDYQSKLSHSLDKIGEQLEKQNIVEPILPVSSTGHLSEATGYLSPSRIVVGFFASVVGMAYMLYSRKTRGMAFGLCGVVLMAVGWALPSLPIAIMICGVAISYPLFTKA